MPIPYPLSFNSEKSILFSEKGDESWGPYL